MQEEHRPWCDAGRESCLEKVAIRSVFREGGARQLRRSVPSHSAVLQIETKVASPTQSLGIYVYPINVPFYYDLNICILGEKRQTEGTSRCPASPESLHDLRHLRCACPTSVLAREKRSHLLPYHPLSFSIILCPHMTFRITSSGRGARCLGTFFFAACHDLRAVFPHSTIGPLVRFAVWMQPSAAAASPGLANLRRTQGTCLSVHLS